MDAAAAGGAGSGCPSLLRLRAARPRMRDSGGPAPPPFTVPRPRERLWSASTQSVRRVVLAGIVVALLVIVVPYVARSGLRGSCRVVSGRGRIVAGALRRLDGVEPCPARLPWR